jgi:hypothetical protein
LIQTYYPWYLTWCYINVSLVWQVPDISLKCFALNELHLTSILTKQINDSIYIYIYIYIQCSLVKPPPSVQSVVWRYNEFGDKLRDIENRKSWKDKLSKIVSTRLTYILHLYKDISINNTCLINK